MENWVGRSERWKVEWLEEMKEAGRDNLSP